MPSPERDLPDWERLLSSAARLQRLLPGAVLVGGTAAAVHARHRRSNDADHTLNDLKQRFDEVLAQLESVAGWKTARVNKPVLILGSLDGIETGVRQLIRKEPLETTQLQTGSGETVTLPTQAEMLRIKAVLIVKRNATRDYLDFVALADQMGRDAVAGALVRFEELYAREGDGSPLQQLEAMLASPAPYDLEGTNLSEYKDLHSRWHDWEAVRAVCSDVAIHAFDELARRRDIDSPP